MLSACLRVMARMATSCLNGFASIGGIVLYPIRGHDSEMITNLPAFTVNLPQFNITLDGCGAPGSTLPDRLTCAAYDGGRFPMIRWTPTPGVEVQEFAIVCEDPDVPIPGLSQALCIVYNIPGDKVLFDHNDLREALAPNATSTRIRWHYIPDARGEAFTGIAPLRGHGTHRYFFTVIALNAPIQFNLNLPVNRDRFAVELYGKVVAYGQWHGVFRR